MSLIELLRESVVLALDAEFMAQRDILVSLLRFLAAWYDLSLPATDYPPVCRDFFSCKM